MRKLDQYRKEQFERRWFKLPNLVNVNTQHKAWTNSNKRFNLIVSGRRSYKTEKCKRFALLGTPFKYGALTKSNIKVLLAAPTFNQAKQIFWQDIKIMSYPFIRDLSEAELKIIYDNGSELFISGLDVPARVEGRKWDIIVIDELADCKANVFFEHIQPMLSDSNDSLAYLVGTPDVAGSNSKEYHELMKIANAGEANWELFTWKSTDILSKEAIDGAMKTMPNYLFRQEYLGEIIQPNNLAYSEFDESVQVKDNIVIDKTLPIRIACDFNRGHMNWLISQVKDSHWYIIDQVYLKNATTEMAADYLKTWLNKNSSESCPLYFYGDYSGNAKTSVATYSNWQIIRNVFTNAKYEYQTNGAIIDRVNKVNATLKNAINECHMSISKSAEQLILDLKYVLLTDLYSSNKTGDRTHSSDALGYMLIQYNDKQPFNPTLAQLQSFTF